MMDVRPVHIESRKLRGNENGINFPSPEVRTRQFAITTLGSARRWLLRSHSIPSITPSAKLSALSMAPS